MEKHIPVGKLTLTALMAALTAVGAFIRIPTPWSAFSMQVFFVLMAGVLLGPKYGALSQTVYIALGLMGLPIFISGGGPMYVLQPTFGFLLSYIPMAAVVGHLCRREAAPGFWRIVGACLAGECVMYAIALPYMGGILHLYLGQNMTAGQILMSGMVLFLPYDAIKILLTGLLGKKLIPALRRMEK